MEVGKGFRSGPSVVDVLADNPRYDYLYDQSTTTQIVAKNKFDQVKACVESKDFKMILQDRNLFWIAFCKSVHQKQDETMAKHFFVKIDDAGEMSISGSPKAIQRVQEITETFRGFFLKAFNNDKKSNEICVISRLGDYYFNDEGTEINDKKYPYFINDKFYDSFIKSALPNLSKACNATYSSEELPLIDPETLVEVDCEEETSIGSKNYSERILIALQRAQREFPGELTDIIEKMTLELRETPEQTPKVEPVKKQFIGKINDVREKILIAFKN